MVRVAVDAMGGDNAPGEIVAGAVMAANRREDIHILLVGRKEAVLRVRDSGTGIAPDALEQIFDLFYTTRSSEGFGIGLFVSRRIAEQHGGTLRAESPAEGGAVMILSLPSPLQD